MKVDKVAIAKEVAASLKDEFNEIVDEAVVNEMPEGVDDSVFYDLISDISDLTFKILADNRVAE